MPATRGTATTATMLFKGGPSLIDLLVDTSEMRIAVTGPRMLFERMELLTTLNVYEGCSVQRLRELAGVLEGEVHCAAVGVEPAEIGVEVHRTGPTLVIGLGPVNMYQSDLVLRTKTGETFRALLQRLLTRDPSQQFIAALHGVTATTHHEHGHGDASSPGGDAGEHGGHAHH